MIKVIDNFLSEKIINKIVKDWPDSDNNCWYKRTDLFQSNQYGCNKKNLIPNSILKTLDYFQSDEFINFINKYLNIKNLTKDEVLHGGGIVQYGRNGHLDLHLDYDIHPLTKKQRRANILLYLNKDWKEEWNGELEFYNGNKLIKKVYPKFNRLVIFEVNDSTWHGFPKKLNCPKNIYRKSINVYYVTEQIKEKCERPRAYFIPGPINKDGEIINLKNWKKEDFENRDKYLKNIKINQYKK